MIDKKLTTKEFKEPKLHRWLFPVIADWLTIIFAFYISQYFNQWFLYIIAALVIGIKQHALFILGHDGAHRVACKSSKLNDFLTNLFCFWPVGTTMEGYRAFHFKHHKYLGTKEDPELEHQLWGAPEWDLPTNPGKIAYYLVKDILGLNLPQIYIIAKITQPPKKVMLVGPILTVTICCTSLILTGFWWVPLLWFGSFLTVYWAVFRLRIWTEHIGTTENTHRLTLNWWQQWIFAPHNTYYHWEHHQWAWVPHWRLPEARLMDRSQPIISLTELIANHMNSEPIKSGMPLTKEPNPQVTQYS